MPASARWSRRLAAAFTERLHYKAAALFFATALWVAASGEEPTSRLVTARFAPTLDASVHLVGRPPVVRVLVAGPARELLKLAAAPPALRHAFGPDTPEHVRLELQPSDVELPTGVHGVTVREVQPSAIALRFDGGRAVPTLPPLPAAYVPPDVARPDGVPADTQLPDSARRDSARAHAPPLPPP